MKVTKLTKDNGVIYATCTPTRLEEMFGKKEVIRKFKRDYIHVYFWSGGPVFVEDNGEEVNNSSDLYNKLRNFDRAWK